MKKLLAFALMLGLSLPALANDENPPPPKPSEAWTQTVGLQLAEALTSANTDIQNQALHMVVNLAAYDKDVDLSATAPALMDIYQHDENESTRIFALAALCALEDGAVMAYLQRNVDKEWSQKVKQLTKVYLANYYNA